MIEHDVLIYNQVEALGYKDIDVIQRKGFSVSTSGDLSELPNLLKDLQKPILVINSGNKSDVQAFADAICANAALKPFPIIFIAKSLAGIENQLNKSFPLALALQQPADPNKIIEALRFIGRNYRSAPLTAKSEIEAPAEAAKIAEQAIEDKEPEITEESVGASIAAATELFATVEDKDLPKIDLGGADLPLLLSGGYRKKVCNIALPEQNDTQERCVEFLSKLKAPTRDILERVNIIALKLITPLNFEPAMVEIIQGASILYAEAFAGPSRSLLTRPYSYRGGVLLRKDICSAIKDSALNIGEALSNKDLSQVISSVGKIIGQESPPENDEYFLAASAIVAADLINRNCYQPFFWNTSAAHSLLRRIRAGRATGIHPVVVCTMLKLLAEALSSVSNAKILGSKKAKEDGEQAENALLVYNETLVDVPCLTAGMRLSRPLRTEDGNAVLDEDLILDDDLILRIWQLSAKKVLSKAVIKRMH